jgi:hypothetical protein
MSAYMMLGFTLYRIKLMSSEGSRCIANLLVRAVIPCMIVKSCLVEYSSERLIQFGISFGLGIVSLLMTMLIAKLLLRKNPVEELAAAFSNAGFIGIPLTAACFGENAVFFLMGMIIFLNLFQFSNARRLFDPSSSGEKIWKKLITPFTIAGLIGIILFVTGFGTKLPEVVTGTLSGISALNAPLAMIVLGVYLAQTRLRELFTNYRLYLISAIRLVLMPAILILLFAWIPVDRTIRMVIITATAAPVGANAAVYAQLYDADYTYACSIVTQSTLLSIVTLPLILAFAEAVMA